MKRLLIFLFLLAAVALQGQTISDAAYKAKTDSLTINNPGKIRAYQIDTLYSYLNRNKIHRDSITNVRILAGDTCLVIRYKTTTDTVCFGTGSATVSISGDTLFVDGDTLVVSCTNYWSLSGDDIENNNTGKVILPGDSTFFDAIPGEATKVGRILHVNQYGEIEWTSPAKLGDTIAVSGGGPWTFVEATGTDTLYNSSPSEDSVGVLLIHHPLELETTTATNGQIKQNGETIFHTYNDGIFIGEQMGNYTMLGNYNIGIGRSSLSAQTFGSNCVGIGQGALASNTEGSNNIGIGLNAGAAVTTGYNNIFLGTNAGATETGHDKLYIENSNADSNNALIFGNFATDAVTINGDLNVTRKTTLNGDSAYFYPLPDEASKVGRVATLLSNGEVQWASPLDVYKEMQDTATSSGSAIPNNKIRVLSTDTIRQYSDFSTAVAAAIAGNIIEINPGTYTESGTVTLPANAVLKFYKGAKLSGTFTLAGDSTRIESGQYQIFGNSITFTGTWIYEAAFLEWFGADISGTISIAAALTDLEQIMHAGAVIKGYPGATYKLETAIDWKLWDNLVIDFQGATIRSSTGSGFWRVGYLTELDDLYNQYFFMDEDSSIFVENTTGPEFERGKGYVKVRDTLDFINNDNYRENFRITIATDSTSTKDTRYHWATGFTYKDFGVVDGDQVIYTKMPLSNDLEVYDVPLYDTSGIQYIQMYPLYKNITVKNMRLENGGFSLGNFYDCTAENLYAYGDDTLMNTNSYAFRFVNGDGLIINNCVATNYDADPGLGYGLYIDNVDNVIVDNAVFGNLQHGIAFAGTYFATTQNLNVNNITLYGTDIDAHGNTFNITATNIKSYGGSRVMNVRSNGFILNGAQIIGSTSPAFKVWNQDCFRQQPTIITNVDMYHSGYGVVELEPDCDMPFLELTNINLHDIDTSVVNKYILQADSSIVDNIYINNCSYINEDNIGALSYFVYLNRVTSKNIIIDNSTVYGATYPFYLNNNLIDNFTVKNSRVELFNWMFSIPVTPADSMVVTVENSKILNGLYLYYFANTQWIRFKLIRNEIEGIAYTNGGSPDKYTMLWDGNRIKNFVSAGKLLPVNIDSTWFIGNTIFDNNKIDFDKMNALRTGTFTAMTFKDSVLIAGANTEKYFNFCRNTLYCEPAAGVSDFFLSDGEVIINDNDFRFARWSGGNFIRVDNVNKFQFMNNRVIISNASLSRFIYAYTDATRRGKYTISGNYIYNQAGTYGKMWDERSTFTNGSTVYKDLNFSIGLNDDTHRSGTTVSGSTRDNTFWGDLGINKIPTVDLDVSGNAHISGYLKTGTGTIANNDSVPSVASYNTFIYNGTANSVSIDALNNHVVGVYYTIIGNSNTYTISVPDGTVAGGDSFNLSSAWTGGASDVLVLYCTAADTFIEVSRSDN